MSVIRDAEVIIPNGFTVLHSGDYIIAVSSKRGQEELRSFFLGKN
jgi:trk system potassium uptake protein TrkA